MPRPTSRSIRPTVPGTRRTGTRMVGSKSMLHSRTSSIRGTYRTKTAISCSRSFATTRFRRRTSRRAARDSRTIRRSPRSARTSRSRGRWCGRRITSIGTRSTRSRGSSLNDVAPLQGRASHHAGEIEVERRAQSDAHERIEEAAPGPEHVAGGELRDFTGEDRDHHLEELDGDAQQGAARAAATQPGNEAVLVRNACEQARSREPDHTGQEQRDEKAREQEFPPGDGHATGNVAWGCGPWSPGLRPGSVAPYS